MSPKPIFLSSCFCDPKGTSLRFRQIIQAETGGTNEEAKRNRPIWMAEDFAFPSSTDGLKTAEICLDGVRQAQCVVVVITSRHGSPIPLDSLARDVHTTFFEAELFEAALLRKPTYIFFLQGYEQEEPLDSLLKLLKPVFPHFNQDTLSEDEVVRRIMRLVERYLPSAWSPISIRSPKLGLFVDMLFRRHHRPYDLKRQTPPLKFLGGACDQTVPQPDATDVASLLDRADREQSHHARLVLIWIAIRSLMGAHYRDNPGSDFMQLWQRALAAWSNNGAWYGLHGHLSLGCLAATSSIAEIQLLSNPDARFSRDYPHGMFASRYYSIAKNADCKQPIFDLALEHVNCGIGLAPDTIDNYAVRGSVFLQIGRIDAALKDYQYVAGLRRSQGGQSYGDALCEWGYAQVKAGQRRQGVENLEKGVELLFAGPPTGFRIRAMRKLAIGYCYTLKIRNALEMAANAHDLAIQMGAFDQIGSVERIAALLAGRRQN